MPCEAKKASVLYTLVLLLCIFICGISVEAATIEVSRPVHRQFYALLESLQDLESGSTRAELKKFLNDHPAFESVYLTLLEEYQFDRRLDTASDYFQNLSSKPLHRRNSLWMLGKLDVLQGNIEAASAAFTAALKAGPPTWSLIRDFVDADSKRRSKSDGALVLRGLGLDSELSTLAAARYAYSRLDDAAALSFFHKLPESAYGNPMLLAMRGHCHFGLLQLSLADSIWQAGRKLARSTGDLKAEIQLLLNLGYLNNRLGKKDAAQEYFELAYSQATRIRSHSQVQTLSGQLAYFSREKADYVEAEKFFAKAIDLAIKLGKTGQLSDWYRGRGMMLYYLGRYIEAIRLLDKCEEYLRNSQNHISRISAKIDKASIYFKLGQYDLAQKALEEARAIAEFRDLEYYEKRAIANLGNIWLARGEHLRAREAFNQFKEFLEKQERRQPVHTWLSKIARSYQFDGKYETAKVHFQDAVGAARQARSKRFEGWSLLRLGDIERELGSLETSVSYYESAEGIASELESGSMLWEVYSGLGDTFRKMGDLKSAISYYSDASAIIEKTRNELDVADLRVGFFAEPSVVYQKLVNAYLERYEAGQPAALDSMFYFYNMGHGRILAEHQPCEHTDSNGPAGDSDAYIDTQSELRHLQRRLRLAGDNLRDTEQWHQLLAELELAKLSLRAHRLRMAGQDSSGHQAAMLQPTLPKILDYLAGSDVGLLLYHITEDASFALVGHQRKTEIVRLEATPSRILAAIDSLMAPFHNVDEEKVSDAVFNAGVAQRLHQMLLDPVEQVIDLPKRLVIVPDFALMNLPFELLLTRRTAKPAYLPADYPDYADAFLAHRYEITYSPTPALLQPTATARSTDPSLLIVANPAGGDRFDENSSSFRSMSWRFDALRYAKKEAIEIKNVHPDSRILERQQATKENLMTQLPNHQALHFATHAFSDTVSDDFSGLVLTAGPDRMDDGILLGYEIPNLQLENCDLVTLSACETARGALIEGEGVLSLPRQFLLAGVKTVVMTHWKVDDRFASELMPSFYRNYIKKGSSKAGALSKAKRDVLGRVIKGKKGYYQHPFFWAAFTLYGDSGTKRDSGFSVYWAMIILLVVGGAITVAVRSRRRSA